MGPDGPRWAPMGQPLKKTTTTGWQSYIDYYPGYSRFQFSERPFLKYRQKHWKFIIKIGNMTFLFPYRLTYDFSILAKNYHTKSTGTTICYIGYPTSIFFYYVFNVVYDRFLTRTT